MTLKVRLSAGVRGASASGGAVGQTLAGVYSPDRVNATLVGATVGRDQTTENQELRIVLADKDAGALKITAGQVRDLGHTPTEIAIDLREAAEAIARDDPDLAIVVVYEDDEHALELIEEMTAYASGPVIALLDREDPSFVARAADRGIFAYARTELTESIQSAIEVAMRRYGEHQKLTEQVDRLEGALQRRALIERAKGILMERQNIGEREAFELLREHARSRNRTVVDVAASVTEGHQLLPRGDD
jgi:response regulator NasT